MDERAQPQGLDRWRVDPRVEPWLLALAAGSLAVAWLAAPGPLALTARAFTLLACVGLWLTRTQRAVALASLVTLAWAADAFLPDLPVGYAARLRLEMVAAIVPLAALCVVASMARRIVRAPRPVLAVALLLGGAATLVRLAEAAILFGRPGDAATLHYALRLDAAASMWGLAALAILCALAAARVARRSRRGHHAAWTAALLGFAVIGSGMPALVVDPGPANLRLGYHADRVADVPESARIVHLEADMREAEPALGVYRFDSIQRELDAAASRGLDVYLLVSTYPPRWLLERYPEAAMVDADGVAFTWIDEQAGASRTRVWEASYAHAEVAAMREDFVRAAVGALAGHASVRWVAVQNEPAYPADWNLLRWASFDPATVSAFREVLRAESGGDLDALNERYRTEFETWDDVAPPRLPFGDLGDRWMRLRETLLITHTTRLMDAARELTDKPVTTKLMAHHLTRFAEPQAGLSDRVYRALADASDVVSVDLYPATRADLVRQLTYFRELAGSKSLIVAEFNLALGTSLPFAGLRMLSALQTLGAYADAVILFTTAGHHLYAIHDGSTGDAAARLYGSRWWEAEYREALGEMARGEASAVAGFPGQLTHAARLALDA